jgi:hypothetical protein
VAERDAYHQDLAVLGEHVVESLVEAVKDVSAERVTGAGQNG